MLTVIIQFFVIAISLMMALTVWFGQAGLSKHAIALRNTFTLFALSFTAWNAGQVLYDLVFDIEVYQQIIDINFVLTVLSAISLYWFCRTLAEKGNIPIYVHFILSLPVIAINYLTQPVTAVKNDAGEIGFQFDLLIYGLLTLYNLGYIVSSIYVLFRPNASKVDKIFTQQRKTILAGVVIGIGLIVISNFILPVLGLSEYTGVLSTAGPAIVIIFFAYAIVNFELFNFRKFFYRAVIYTLSIIIVLLVISTVSSFILVSGFRDQLRELTNVQYSLIISSFSIFGVLFFRFTELILQKAGQKLYFRNSFNQDDVYRSLEPFLRSIDLETVCSGYLKVISDELNAEDALIVVISSTYGESKEYVYSTNGNPEKSLIDRVYTIINSDSKLEEIEKVSSLPEFELILPISHKDYRGMLLIGHKLSGRPIYGDERAAIRNTASDLSLAIQNSMQYQAIVSFNEELENKIQKATMELQESNKKLKALDEAKDEFISMASHQLRTPLTSVKGYISMVLEGDAGKLDEPKKKLLDEAFASSQRMVYLIADLLNVSRLKTGKFVIEPSEVDLGLIVEEEVHQLKPIAASRKLKIKYSRPRKFPKVWLDETKIRQVIMNFIDNAIYYTKSGGTIEVKLIARKDEIEYAVTDNGIGVPKEQQAKLFTKFFRANNARKARPDGTGLGLYMARRVISAQGGSALFESEEGKGSTFGFRFPLKSVKTRQNLEAQVKANQGQAELSVE